MTESVSREILLKVRKLAQLPEEAKRSRFAVSITRLTVLKSLCKRPDVASRFVTHLARRTWHKVREKAKRPSHLSMEELARHRKMIHQTVTAMEKYLAEPIEQDRSALWKLLHELEGEQNEHRPVYGGPVRAITDSDLLLVEYALHTVLANEDSIPLWAYQTARHYAERYDSSHGTGLIPASAPLMQDIVDYWLQEFGLSAESITTPARKPKEKKLSANPRK